jgi:hypothetical protein
VQPATAQQGAAPVLSPTLPPPNGKPLNVKGLGELVEAFKTACLDLFPDDAAVAAKATAENAMALSADQLRRFLHDDPGHGWSLRRGDIVLALTIELPPFHSCTVRTALPNEPDVVARAMPTVKDWGMKQHPAETLFALPPQTVRGNGAVQVVHQFPLLGPDKKAIESIAVFMTQYPNTETVEVRLVRMRGNNPR